MSEHQSPQRKPLNKQWWFWAIIGVAGFSVLIVAYATIAVLLGWAEDPATEKLEVVVAQVVDEEEPAIDIQGTIDGYIGKSAKEAYTELTDLGYQVIVIHDKSKTDLTSVVIEETETVWLVVKSQNLKAKEKTGTLCVDTAENIELSKKLSSSAAWIAASDYGKKEYPYGFTLHYLVGRLAETPKDENTWFLKATCDVTNTFGTKAKGLTCEIEVTGTTDNPRVVSFIVY